MEGIIVLSVIAVIVIVAIVVSVINNKNLRITKEYSRLYITVTSLNNRYKFHSISNSMLKFNPILKSKRSLENLDIYQYIANEIGNSQSYYSSLFNKIDENIRDYRNYQSEYKGIERYTTEEEFAKYENIKLKYKTFVSCEKKLYKQLKLKEPTMDLSAQCHATYTSPSGKNHYWRDASYTFNQLKQMLRNIEQKQKIAIIEKERKEKLAQEKREKEKKLRELNKLEAKLSQKEKEINEKEQEFIEATKEHIYTADKVEVQKQEIEIDENLSLSQKLKLLRTKFDNGEITYEEYQAKRKELM